MLQRHTKLREHAEKMDDVGIDALLLSPAAERSLDVLIEKFVSSGEVTKKRQRSDNTLKIVRDYLDIILEYYSSLSKRLDLDARIVQHLFFESGILMIQSGQEEALTTVSKSELADLLLD